MAGKRVTAPAKRAGTNAADNVVALPARSSLMYDGLTNLISGLGGVAGKRGADTYVFNQLNPLELSNMYRSDWMARKAVDIIAEDMTKAWRTWALKPNQITAIDRAEVALGLRRKIRDAVKWGRLFGGGALIISDGKNSEKPITVEDMGKGGIKYVVAVPRTMLDAGDSQLSWDPSGDHWGQPEFYRLQVNGVAADRGPQARRLGNVRIHHSRVIRFLGNPYPDPMQTNDPWSDSILQSVWESIRDAGLALQSSAQLVEEAKLDVMQMENLASYLAGGDESNKRLMERMRLFKLGKSTFNLALMGGKETFDSKTVNFGSLDKVLFVFLQVASGATDIPATRFLGQSPAGMNSTGESDLRNYADVITSKQEDMEGDLRFLDELLLKHALGSVPKSWFYEWNSIWQMSPKEAAEVNKINAEADQIYINSGVVPTMAVEKAIIARMIDSGLYPGLEEAMLELSEEDLEVKRPDPQAPPLDPNKNPANFPKPEPGAE